MSPRQARGGLRLWWLVARDHIVLALLLALVFLGCAGLVAFVMPTGPARPVQGVVTRVYFHVEDEGHSHQVHIHALVNGRPLWVTPFATHTCAAGDRITLQMIPRLVGANFRAAGDPCAEPG